MLNRRTTIVFLLLYLATVASKCSEELGGSPRQYGQPAEASAPLVQSYGVSGDITKSEAPVVAGLITPGTQPIDGVYYFAQAQSRHAITSRIGFPASYSGDTDFYHLANGDAQIIYNNQGQAVGVRQP